MNSLRAILREKTSDAHEALDAALIDYDLTSRSGLRDYLRVHYRARVQLTKLYSGHPIEVDHTQSLSALQSDLSVLGAKLPHPMNLELSGDLHPVGVTYVVAGSSLGSKLLFKHWSRAVDEKVRQAGTFMTRAKDNADWIKFLAYIDAADFSAKEIEHIVISANGCFAIFEAAIHTVDGPTG